jgi:hypothetical protein
MSEATRLRAQKTFSTDPDYLERMALAEEDREARARRKDEQPGPATKREQPLQMISM